MIKKIAIVGYSRTPIGSFLGSLSGVSASNLGSIVIKSLIKKKKLNNFKIDEIIMGQVLTSGAGQSPARQSALMAKVAYDTQCTNVNKVCGSGLKSIIMAHQSIILNQANIIIAGGMENMSQSPYLLLNSRSGLRMGNHTFLDSIINDGLMDPYEKKHMGYYGDLCAHTYEISRYEQDLFAQMSYEKSLLSIKNGLFSNEISPVTVKTKKNEITIIDDEEPSNFNPDKMFKLKSVFSRNGTITAANASKISDGAAGVILMDLDFAKKNNFKILAEIVSFSTFSCEPKWFTTAPIFSIKDACKKANIAVSDVDLFEINEAFSVVPLVAIKHLKIKQEKVNIFGGAVSLGHPIGCSGARIVCTLLNAMEYKDSKIGCASICLGGGGAISLIIKR